jgi:hypothetical protein
MSCSPDQEVTMQQAKSYYVRRVSAGGREGYVGSLRPLSRAEREAQAWREAGGSAEVLPNTPDVRTAVRAWEKGRR